MAARATPDSYANSAKGHAPTLALFTMRGVNCHVSRCVRYEAEAVVGGFYDSDLMIAERSPLAKETLFERGLARVFRAKARPGVDDVYLARDFDLFFMICNGPNDLWFAERILNLERARTAVCCFEEGWTSEGLSEENVRLLRRFDVILSNLESNVATLSEATKRPCYHSAWGIDALAFCPRPQPARAIDVYSMGRRSAEVHEQLLAIRASDPRFYYVHDTVSNFQVERPFEHRRLTIDTIWRSRYFVAYPGRFNHREVTNGIDELSARFFEGAAGGSVLIGRAPDCDSFRRHFDWPDAVIPIDEPVSQVLARINRDPDRQSRIRRDNVINCLERHDWAYRWRDILRLIDQPEPPAVGERIARLQDLANVIRAEWRPAQM